MASEITLLLKNDDNTKTIRRADNAKITGWVKSLLSIFSFKLNRHNINTNIEKHRNRSVKTGSSVDSVYIKGRRIINTETKIALSSLILNFKSIITSVRKLSICIKKKIYTNQT